MNLDIYLFHLPSFPGETRSLSFYSFKTQPCVRSGRLRYTSQCPAFQEAQLRSVSLTLSIQLRKPCLLPDQCLLLHQPLLSTGSSILATGTFRSPHPLKKKCVSSQPTPGRPWATKALEGRICITDSCACFFPFPTAHPHLAMDLAEDFSHPGGCYTLSLRARSLPGLSPYS